MSLEQAIIDLTAAVKENTAALQAAPTGRGKKSTPASGTSEPSATVATPPPTATAAPTATTTSTPVTPPAAPTVTLKDWTDAFCKLGDTSRAGREAALGILAKFKVERASLVKPENYAEALALAKEEQAKLDNAPASAQSLV